MGARPDPHIGSVPMYAKGCRWRFWSGVIGISTKLVVFDRNTPAGYPTNLTPAARRKLAAYMIELWTKFGEFEG
ncbi:hypothetical protein AFEL58S_02018 [Afipia felis]